MSTKIARAGLFVTGLTSIAIAAMAMIGGPSPASANSPNRMPYVADTPTPPPPVTAAVTPPPGNDFADPYVLKAVNNAQVKPGDTIEFVLVVGNKGNVDAVNVQVRDTLPNHLDIVSVTTTKGTVTIDGRKILVDIGTVGVTEFVTIKITAKGNDTMVTGQCENITFLNTSSGGDRIENNASGVTYICGEVVNPPTGGYSNGRNAASEALTWALVTAGLIMIGASLVAGRRKNA
ncbi:MAG: DUF11 domain-containing protein [Anaerolineae bacterium]|nr:DUF11 domain-containing protein [Anaerolineae bacterium]